MIFQPSRPLRDNGEGRAGGRGSQAAAAHAANNRHWLSDVAMEAVLGITAGLQAVGREERRDRESALRILPDTRGLTVVYLLP